MVALVTRPRWVADDTLRRIGLSLVGAWCGQVTAMLILTRCTGGWGMLSPVVGAGAMLGAVLTPGASLLLAITAAWTAAYVVLRVPRWAVLGVAAGVGGIIYWTMSAWQTHAP